MFGHEKLVRPVPTHGKPTESQWDIVRSNVKLSHPSGLDDVIAPAGRWLLIFSGGGGGGGINLNLGKIHGWNKHSKSFIIIFIHVLNDRSDNYGNANVACHFIPCPCHMSNLRNICVVCCNLLFFTSLSQVVFKKSPCRRVDFKGQGP